MTPQASYNHREYWVDLLSDLDSIGWLQITGILMKTNHGYSNYRRCKLRNHTQVRQDVYEDERVKNFISQSKDNANKVKIVLDEMCHLLEIQTNPTRKLKFSGPFFIKCITNIYSNLYVNTHLLPVTCENSHSQLEAFKSQYLKISKDMPIIILPTHRSYMDFLFITYIMLVNELPLPVVAGGDNFMALGKILSNYLKATGAFLIRRNANNKHDIEASNYFDILRAYVHSIIGGGENPLEFFMEGTRTRSGQVLRPKTGLLSMVVDMYLDGKVDDICILPVTINYQRPIEEQLYVFETTPQISTAKPKENIRNLITGFESIMRRKYGKVYVRFIKPFKLSDYYNQWRGAVKMIHSNETVKESIILQEFTNSLASKICLAQAYSNVMMPFNLMSYSISSRSFLSRQDSNDSTIERSLQIVKVPLQKIAEDFSSLEDLLKRVNPEFVAGWKGHLDIIQEFKIDRDGIIAASSDRKSVEFKRDSLTFHTFSYYSNQVMQMLLPIAISSLFVGTKKDNEKSKNANWEQYKSIRFLLSREFLIDNLSLEKEFNDSVRVIDEGYLGDSAKNIILKHLLYFIESYLIFLGYLSETETLIKANFFQSTTSDDNQHFISKDMLNNMMNLVKDLDICTSVMTTKPGTKSRRDEQLKVQSGDKLQELTTRFDQVAGIIRANIMEMA